MSAVICSPANKLIKEVASLKQKKYRDELGLFIAEGVRIVEECAASAWPVHICIYTETAAARERTRRVLDRLAAARCRLVAVPEAIYNKLSDTEQPQGIMAVLKKRQATLAQMLAPAGQVPLIVVLDGIQDPGNAGAIIRTADAAGCTGVIVVKGAADIYAGKTVRATMGSLFHLPVWEGVAPGELITALTAANVSILATSLQNADIYYHADLKRPVAVVLGNEGQGVGRELLDKADGCLTIPLVGDAESLNVAVAAGVILYEAVRQRATL
ncbi:TrmH family RNA methyltransferase [Sporomusa termitida]|uniref:23S rRNA (Uridine(2479)-2'-O)-methyltransferase n=1 Tax=Sporomusa termitida TaxID=2377 RepID=A0A517DUC5_9FIRM|nr:RNA methyltransferase [Sporomusa termitida]QDR80886.1 23S rRNA (uridine(2479)-2'-O)-methyltransferase [Sporomusa termitida]